MMRIGFSGTRDGMTSEQQTGLEYLLELFECTEFHHGDCLGADAEAHVIAARIHVPIIIHPPKDFHYRAFCETWETRPPQTYLTRNHHIVDETDALIATPKQAHEIERSGTWATVRYARKQGKPFHLILPDGTILTGM